MKNVTAILADEQQPGDLSMREAFAHRKRVGSGMSGCRKCVCLAAWSSIALLAVHASGMLRYTPDVVHAQAEARQRAISDDPSRGSAQGELQVVQLGHDIARGLRVLESLQQRADLNAADAALLAEADTRLQVAAAGYMQDDGSAPSAARAYNQAVFVLARVKIRRALSGLRTQSGALLSTADVARISEVEEQLRQAVTAYAAHDLKQASSCLNSAQVGLKLVQLAVRLQEIVRTWKTGTSSQVEEGVELLERANTAIRQGSADRAETFIKQAEQTLEDSKGQEVVPALDGSAGSASAREETAWFKTFGAWLVIGGVCVLVLALLASAVRCPDSRLGRLLSRPTVSLHPPSVQQLTAVLQTGDEAARVRAAVGLHEHPGPAAVGALTRALTDDSAKVRSNAAESLRVMAARRECSIASVPLLDALTKEPDLWPLKECLRVLGAGDQVDEILNQAYTADPRCDARCMGFGCPHCGVEITRAPSWPINGDTVPFYAQKGPSPAGAHQVELICPRCGGTVYVVWDHDPIGEAERPPIDDSAADSPEGDRPHTPSAPEDASPQPRSDEREEKNSQRCDSPRRQKHRTPGKQGEATDGKSVTWTQPGPGIRMTACVIVGVAAFFGEVLFSRTVWSRARADYPSRAYGDIVPGRRSVHVYAYTSRRNWFRRRFEGWPTRLSDRAKEDRVAFAYKLSDGTVDYAMILGFSGWQPYILIIEDNLTWPIVLKAGLPLLALGAALLYLWLARVEATGRHRESRWTRTTASLTEVGLGAFVAACFALLIQYVCTSYSHGITIGNAKALDCFGTAYMLAFGLLQLLRAFLGGNRTVEIGQSLTA